MTERPRSVLVAWAVACLVVVGVFGFLVTHDRVPLDGFDVRGRHLEDWADQYPLLVHVLRVVEVVFDAVGMTVITAVLAAALLWKRHRRAAGYVVLVMVSSTIVNRLLKIWLGRDRPSWQDEVGLYESESYPSGHATSIAAFCVICLVLSSMFIRRKGMRRLIAAGLVLLWLAVCLDRLLLGRHYPSDVIGGTALGIACALLGLVVLNPLPRSSAGRADPLPEAVPTTRQLAVVLNPVKVEDVAQFQAVVAAMAAESGWGEPGWHLTTVEDPGTGMAHAAAVAGADLVLVCGGDGTVREVCAELAGTGIPVGIVPAGTGNLLARNLDVPLYLRAAIDVALNGQDRAIDLAAVSGDGFEPTHFMVMAGMGLDAAIMEGVNEDIKKRVGWFAYVISALKSLMSPAVRIDISVDGGDFTTHRARTVVVGNVGYLQAGMPLLPDAAIDDGLLDVVILHPRRFLSWVPLALRVLSKHSRTDETINRMTGRTVTLRAPAETPRQLDGDILGPGKELHMECLPGRLLVRVPR